MAKIHCVSEQPGDEPRLMSGRGNSDRYFRSRENQAHATLPLLIYSLAVRPRTAALGKAGHCEMAWNLWREPHVGMSLGDCNGHAERFLIASRTAAQAFDRSRR